MSGSSETLDMTATLGEGGFVSNMSSMERLLRVDVDHLRHLYQSRIQASRSSIVRAAEGLPLPSLTVIGAHPGVVRGTTTALAYGLAREALTERQSVTLASGVETSFRVRAECLLGSSQLRQILVEPESIDTEDLPLHGLNRYEASLRFDAYGCESDLRLVTEGKGHGPRSGPASLIVIDHVTAVECLTAGGPAAITPLSLRFTSRRWSSAVVVMTTWAEDDRTRWERHADQVLDIFVNEIGDAVISDGRCEVELVEPL